jgi:hypothetical protein
MQKIILFEVIFYPMTKNNEEINDKLSKHEISFLKLLN